MASGMYPQAIELLNKAIHEKPTNAEAHFQQGICYVNTGNFRNADERFASAVTLDNWLLCWLIRPFRALAIVQ